jgi:hypothetical protein
MLFQVPSSESEWLEVAQVFAEKWQLPNCIGAIDGKHIQIVKPAKSGATYINYKGYFSIVLMALVDAEYQLLFVDVGSQGRMSDGGIFANSVLSSALQNNTLNIPSARALVPNGEKVPFYIVGDDAFPLRTYLMKPYSKRELADDERITNYRISRGRRVSENAFGIMANVFRVLHTPILLSPRKAEKVVLAICALHNFLRARAKSEYLSACSESAMTAQDSLTQLQPSIGGNATNAAKDVRNTLKEFFVGEGRVSWQDTYVNAF